MLKVTAFPFASILMILACQYFLFEEQFNKQSLAFHVEGKICNGIHLPGSSSSACDRSKRFAVNMGRALVAPNAPRVHRMKMRCGWGTIFRMILDSAYISFTLEIFPKEVELEPAITLMTLKGRTDRAVGMPKFGNVRSSWLYTSGKEGS